MRNTLSPGSPGGGRGRPAPGRHERREMAATGTSGRRTATAALCQAALLGVALAVMPADSAAAFAATPHCGDGPGPICYIEHACVDWAIGWSPTWPNFYVYCAKWEIVETRYWNSVHEESDSSSAEEEGSPVTPEGEG